ncbi:CBS domain-containing protein [Microbulbifer sp. 2201CG32-9]|uniref:CBS domain-containing protein n=1 Tax=unclassified Microbulbifer TaxID=2619833 RepID=UPI00345BD0E6
MKNLDFLQLEDLDQLVYPENFSELSLDSPALSFVTDFKDHHPPLLTPSVAAADAAKVMQAGHLNTVLVVDNEGRFSGLLTAEDISSQRVMQFVAAGMKRDELTVADLMRPRSQLKMLSYEQVSKSRIREVLGAMRRDGQKDCLVVDTEMHHVRGLISAAETGQRLHAEINIDEAPTVAGILRELAPVH